MKLLLPTFLILFCFSCQDATDPLDSRKVNFPTHLEKVSQVPTKENVWIFILAGQSNMAGRGLVAPEDTLSHLRILALDKLDQLIYAKEPLHHYEPKLQGLDCGMAFARKLVRNSPDSISILMVPTAVGGSSVEQWLNDDVHRGVKLLSNFRSKARSVADLGVIKAILWHQGESNAHPDKLPTYGVKLDSLIGIFREAVGNDTLPILLGELPAFPKNYDNRQAVNGIIHGYVQMDDWAEIIYTQDLKHKGDSTHFDAAGQRKMGERFADVYLDMLE
ncbi:MAG: sialate O-acetylesterase [Saprospiraceae bacterium]|nr:sialate O-acetylesterase [Saprospiraceae bacterium]